MLLFDSQERRPLFDFSYVIFRGVSASMKKVTFISTMGKMSGKTEERKNALAVIQKYFLGIGGLAG